MRDGGPSTATYVLIHGAGDVGWYWHLVEAELRARRHRVVVMDLPAPIVCARVPARLLVLVAAMVPAPGESAEAMFGNTGYVAAVQDDHSDLAVFYHDVDPALAAEALAKGRRQSETPGKEPWPLDAWPDVPTRYLLCRRDRLFPAAWLRRVVRERLRIVPDEIESGHTPALSHPKELVQRLEGYRAEVWRGHRR